MSGFGRGYGIAALGVVFLPVVSVICTDTSIAAVTALSESARSGPSGERLSTENLSPSRGGISLEALVQLHSTPERVAQFLRERVVFRDDVRLFGLSDYWQDPQDFLSRGRGDCEDYALLAQAVLSRQGMEAFVFSLYGEEGYAHTVCVFIEGGRYNVINQDRLLRYRANSLEEVAGLLCPRWRWGAVAQKQGTRGRAVRLVYPVGLDDIKIRD